MAMTDFTIIRRSLLARKFSTVVTTLMVAVSVGLMLLLLAMPQASQQAFERGAGNMHMLVSRDASPLVAVLNGVFHANPPRNPISWAKYREIATGFPLEFAIPVQMGDSYRGFPVVASTPEMFSQFKPAPEDDWEFAEGRPFEDTFELVVGAEAAERTGLRIGDEIYLTHGSSSTEPGGDEMAPHVHREFGYQVVGLLARTGGPQDRAIFSNLDSTWIIHAHDRRQGASSDVVRTTVDDLLDSDRQITGIYLRVMTRRGSQMSGAQQQIFDMLRRDTSITVADPGVQIENLFGIVSSIEDIFVAMAAVVMVASGIAILLALYNSMEQRRRQIAVLRVLGSTRGRIFGLIVTESALIGILGAVAGIGLTVVGGRMVATAMKARLGLVIEPGLPLESTLIIVVATILLAAAAGLIPAFMGYRTTVVRNLRPLG